MLIGVTHKRRETLSSSDRHTGDPAADDPRGGTNCIGCNGWADNENRLAEPWGRLRPPAG